MRAIAEEDDSNVVMQWTYDERPPPDNKIVPYKFYRQIGETIYKLSQERPKDQSDDDFRQTLERSNVTFFTFRDHYKTIWKCLPEFDIPFHRFDMCLNMLEQRSKVLLGEVDKQLADSDIHNTIFGVCVIEKDTQPLAPEDANSQTIKL